MDDWIVTLGILCGGAGIVFLIWDIIQRRSQDRYTAYLRREHASLTLVDPAAQGSTTRGGGRGGKPS